MQIPPIKLESLTEKSFNDFVQDFERIIIEPALIKRHGDVANTAKYLGMTCGGLNFRLIKLGIDPNNYRPSEAKREPRKKLAISKDDALCMIEKINMGLTPKVVAKEYGMGIVLMNKVLKGLHPISKNWGLEEQQNKRESFTVCKHCNGMGHVPVKDGQK